MNDENNINMETYQYLSFKLDDEIFALEISRVREVLEFTRITRVPKTPEFLMGVINLRGRVVPVVDIKRKFAMGKTSKTIDTCIIITEIMIDEEPTVVGAMADSVREVIKLEPEEIEPAPRIGTRLDTAFIKGMGKKNDEFIIILDINKVLSASELSIVKDSQEVKPPVEPGAVTNEKNKKGTTSDRRLS